MKIERNIFSDFLRKVQFSPSIQEATLNFTEDCLRCKLWDSSLVAYVIAEIDKKMFKEYKPIGLVGIRDIGLLKRHVDSLGKIVTINTKDGFLFLSEGGKKRIIKSADETFIDEKEVKIEFKNAIKVDKSLIDSIIKGCALFKDEDCPKVDFKSDNGTLVVTIYDDIDKVIESAQVSLCEKAHSEFSRDFLSKIFKSLGDGEITLFLHTDAPMKITEVNKECGLNTEFVLAPMVNPVDDKEEDKNVE